MEAYGTRSSSQLPYLTHGVAGIGGRIRSEPEDFRVDERPLYLPCGEGEHLYLRVTKRLLSTPDLVRQMSSTLGVKVQGIGTAGLKDARAVTTQLVSLHGVPEERVSRLKLDGHILAIEVLGRHRNRLRPGHHAGNRFRLVIRDVSAGAGEAVPAILEELSRRGIPNYFGPQRQGKTGDNYQVGAALLTDGFQRATMSRAKRMWYVNTFQSYLFNQMLSRRIDRIDRMLTQLRLSGILSRAGAIVFGELPRCDEPADNGPAIRAVIADLLDGFGGPVLFGLPSGHTTGPCLTLPFGVRARVVTAPEPQLIIEEAAVAA